MNPSAAPDFYTGPPVEPEDLRFRDEFLEELWETLATKHVLLTAPRRTGKTSVMDHLRDYPRDHYLVIAINVQDLSHPADFFQTLLDAFHDAHPDWVRDSLSKGWSLLGTALSKVKDLSYAGFKLALREADPNWRTNWRTHGSEFLKQARSLEKPILFVVDELPDMLINLAREDQKVLREFLGWFRTQRLKPSPKRDSIRWLVGGSVNLSSTLDGYGMVDLINDIEDVSLPILTDGQIEAFVYEMLKGRNVPHDESVPARVIARLGRPIPLFMQMATQDLYRHWKKSEEALTHREVDLVFDSLITKSAARDKLQHFYSRIDQYYMEPKRSIAYTLLSNISLTEKGESRPKLLQITERLLTELGETLPSHQRMQLFNQLLRDLENDFYVVEVAEDRYDFASGVLKAWWRKYYA